MNALNGVIQTVVASTWALHYGGIGWALVVAAVVMTILAFAMVVGSWRWLEFAIRPEISTVVRFDEAALLLERTGRRGKREHGTLPLRKVKTVRLFPEALTVSGALRIFLIVPRRALTDDGAPVMRYFADRLVGRAMLQRSSTSVTTIVNTALR